MPSDGSFLNLQILVNFGPSKIIDIEHARTFVSTETHRNKFTTPSQIVVTLKCIRYIHGLKCILIEPLEGFSMNLSVIFSFCKRFIASV